MIKEYRIDQITLTGYTNNLNTHRDFFWPPYQHQDFGTCKRDYDCVGTQKCCHVQVAKHRFKLGCRFPRVSNYYY